MSKENDLVSTNYLGDMFTNNVNNFIKSIFSFY